MIWVGTRCRGGHQTEDVAAENDSYSSELTLASQCSEVESLVVVGYFGSGKAHLTGLQVVQRA